MKVIFELEIWAVIKNIFCKFKYKKENMFSKFYVQTRKRQNIKHLK